MAAKYNVVQKQKRAESAARKRAIHGDTLTKKLKQKAQPLTISGKRKNKLFKKRRREQKEAASKGLISMQDVEMAMADGTAAADGGGNGKTPMKFNMKKTSSKLKLRQLKRNKGNKGNKKQKNNNPASAGTSLDVMEE